MIGARPEQVALVTGAGGDIARAVALRLAGVGVHVLLADLEQARTQLATTAEDCNEIGGDTTVMHVDVTEEGAVVAALASAAEAVGPPTFLFNNAGIQGNFQNVADYDIEDARRVIDVNVIGVLIVLKCCAGLLIEAGQPGSFVNTASMAATGAPNMIAYSASKSAVIGLTKSAAKDLAPVGIRVNSISPAFIGPGMMWDRQVRLQADTPSQYYADDPSQVERQMIDQVPLRRYGSLDEVASTAMFLLSDESSYLTGINIEVAGGAS